MKRDKEKGKTDEDSQEWQDVTLRAPSGLMLFVKMSKEQIRKMEEYKKEHPETTAWEAAMKAK
ncbi:MAG: hypothetical protein J6X92_01815 [Bacteroidales bacterium]|nr:hypothetical protein [Bacteroidales bacterium]